MERGEVDRAISTLVGIKKFRPAWLHDEKIRVVMQLSLKRFSDSPNASALPELARTESDRALIAFFVSANTISCVIAAPVALVGVLRIAFDDTMRL